MEIRTITGKVRHSLVSAAQYYGRSVIRESLIIRIVTRRRRSPYYKKSKPLQRCKWLPTNFGKDVRCISPGLLSKLRAGIENEIITYTPQKVMEILNTTGMLIYQAPIEEIINVPIEENWAGGYKLEYDGKYITLLGKDKKYPVLDYYGTGEDLGYETVVLIPIVTEVRYVIPEIQKVTETHIEIKLTKTTAGNKKDEDT